MAASLCFRFALVTRKSVRAASTLAVACFVLHVAASSAAPQPPDVHYQHQAAVPPGAIGRWQLERGGPLRGHFQPMEIKTPDGAEISLAEQAGFNEAQPAPLLVGMLIGPVYRLRVTSIPHHDGAEVYPTVEVIDRLCPPPGQELRFPVPIELTQQDLELALNGKFVMRVIYVENPLNALPAASEANQMEWFDAAPGDNPVEVADRLGRPIAIVRMGGRVPDVQTGPDAAFLYGSPPYMLWPYRREMLERVGQLTPRSAALPLLNRAAYEGDSTPQGAVR